MKTETTTNLIRMFNKVLASPSSGKLLDFKAVNKVAMPLGYIVAPEACYEAVLSFLEEQYMNPSSTFYKTWEDVKSKSSLELCYDQLLHYFSTYGTGFAFGNGYVPNAEVDYVPYTTYKYISAASRNELFEDCKGMLESGIAMSSQTINILLDYIKEQGFLKDINLDKIKNKEAQCILSMAKGILPSDEFSMLRVLVYAATGSSMLIKSQASLDQIKLGANKAEVLLNNIDQEKLKKLSRIFLRYKPIFLSLKNDNTKSTINRIRKFAVKYHTPLKAGFWETILNPADKEEVFTELPKQLEKITAFKKLQVMGGIKTRVNSVNSKGRLFIIRNGSMFVRKNYHSPTDLDYLMKLYQAIEKSVVDELRSKATTYKTLNGVELAAPTSEKNFLGNFPMGTTVEIGKDAVVGIYWRNEWGVRDYDLHYTNVNGQSYGWCYGYKNEENSIIFSGDMTNAEPEAAECFLINGEAPEGRFNVNIFYSSGVKVDKRKLRFFVASATEKNAERIKKHKKSTGYKFEEAPMVDSDTIKFDSFVEFENDTDYSEKTLGYVHDGKIYLVDLTSGCRQVTAADMNEIVQEQLKIACDSYVGLERLLQLAGFQKVGESEDAELDLTNPAKDQLIKLFA